MLHQKPRPATYADIEVLPPHVVGEIVHGVLHVHRYPPYVSYAAAALMQEMRTFGKPRGGSYWMLRRPEVHLADHVIVPDIAAWCREMVPQLPHSHMRIAPDWVVELLHPSTQKLDRTDKLAVYAEFGVKHCWYVDPLARTLEVFALVGDKWQLAATFKDADPVAAPPFEVHTFPLDVLWAPDASHPVQAT